MNQGAIQVKSLGEFAIYGEDGRFVTEDEMRSTAMVKFLMYILTHRDHMNSKEELIENLWHEGEVENPAGALKNITYRVRTFLRDHLGDQEYIVSVRGAYAWNEEIPVELDVEKFEHCYDKAMDESKFPDDRITWCEQLIQLYQGSFGAKIGDLLWAANRAMYYQTRYIRVVKELIGMYRKSDSYERIIALANDALAYDPLNEDLYCDLIDALVATNQRKCAEDVYETASKLFYEELGMRNPEGLTKAHAKILKMSKGTKSDSITEVHEDIEEKQVDGAFFCGYPVFREIYRLEARKTSRLGNAEYVVLFSTESRKAQSGCSLTKAEEFMLNKGMRRFEKVLDDSLRVGDVVSRYSDLQYIVLLSSCSYEASRNVAERIIRKFNSGNANDDLVLKYSLEEVALENHLHRERSGQHHIIEETVESA